MPSPISSNLSQQKVASHTQTNTTTTPNLGASITDKAAQFFSNILQAKFEKRNAVKYKSPGTVSGHKFETVFLTEPRYCSQCNKFIFGLLGLDCGACKLAVHEKCLDCGNIPECAAAKQTAAIGGKSAAANRRTPIERAHRFEKKTFLSVTMCDHCGTLIKGFYKQGFRCFCGMNVHDSCKLLVCKECEVNDSDGAGKQSNDIIGLFKRLVPLSGNSSDDNNNQEIPEQQGRQLRKQQQRQQQGQGPSTESKPNISNFQILRLLGTGAFGRVYLAKLMVAIDNRNGNNSSSEQECNDRMFAIKVINKSQTVICSDPESVFTEWRALRVGTEHPFLAVAHCCFQTRDRLFLVMEHVVGRDLVYHIDKARKFSEHRAKFYAAELVLALSYLHRKGIVYRDLKLDNVILDQSGHCKLLDFGMAKELSREHNMRTRTFCGTPSYISPEIIRGDDYNYSVDWWSLGVLMYEMLVGCSPFEAQDEEEIYKLILNERVAFPRSLSDQARSILEGLLTKEPHNRLGCQPLDGCEMAIKEHPFFLFPTSNGHPIDGLHQWEALEQKALKVPYVPRGEDLELEAVGLGEDGYEGDGSIDFSSPARTTSSGRSQDDFRGFSQCSESFGLFAQLN